MKDEYGPGLWVAYECTAPADRWRIAERAYSGTPLDVFDHAADVIVERLTGWHRWEAEFVWRAALGAWPEVDGDLLGRGVDVSLLPPARATNTVYAWLRGQLSQDDKAWKKFQKDMRHEPRRVVLREAEKPMPADDQAELQRLIASQ
ncbi:hypothetical protein [Gordonia liuliyuniae]|uniref:hypothetical protein n=1 Tax=Gordonia liuliyuniae TaxID=2911517 RepID=UPI001F397502|nr:hypothetical protein [Gordonia liuliyuniae]